MPSPIGHAVAGLIIGLASRPETGSFDPARSPDLKSRPPYNLVLCYALVAALPDLDWIYPPLHRGPTHSLGATLIVTLAAAAMTWWWTGRPRWRIAIFCGLAQFSHVVMDWLGEDLTQTPGVMMFWPLSDERWQSGWNLFRSTWRLDPLAPPHLIYNAKALAQEMAILGPILLWLLWRRRRLTAALPPDRHG